MKKFKVLAIAAATVVATTLPLSASANAAPPAQPETHTAPTAMTVNGAVAKDPATVGLRLAYEGPGTCRHAWILIDANLITARQSKSTTSLGLFSIPGPALYPCRSFEIGTLYRDVCGRDNTGWILVVDPNLANERQGWIPSQCTLDPILGS